MKPKRFHLFESLFMAEGSRMRARLIREGKSKNGNNWTRKALEQIAAIANGKPITFYDMSQNGDRTFAAHWEQLRMKLPPAVRGLLPQLLPDAQIGVVRNAEVVEEGGKAAVMADVELTDKGSWFSGFLGRTRALGRDLGLSIFVPEGGLEGKQLPGGGVEPETVSEITAFEVVSFPSAGGGFVPVLEALMEVNPMKDFLKRLMRMVAKEKRSLVEALKLPDGIETAQAFIAEHKDIASKFMEALGLKITDPALQAAALEAIALVAPAEDPPAPKKAAEGDPVKEPEKKEDAALESRVKGLSEDVKRLLKTNSLSALEAALAASKLPKALVEFTREHWKKRLEAQGVIEGTELDEFIAGLKKGLGGAGAPGGGLLEGIQHRGPYMREEWNSADKVMAAFDAMIEGKRFGVLEGDGKTKIQVPAFTGPKQAYQVMTGDMWMEGAGFYGRQNRPQGAVEGMSWDGNQFAQAYMAVRHDRSILEGITTATYPLILSDRMHKAMLREYAQQDLQWKLVARPVPVTDFKTWRFERFGEFPNLAVVAQNGAYLEVTDYPNEEEITLQIVKRGGLANWTWEAMLNDDLTKLRSIPTKLARAAARTLNEAVFDLILTNAVIYDGVALAAAGHSNITASAASLANLQAMRRKMFLQKDLDAREAGRFTARHVFCGPSTMDALYGFIFSDGKPTLVDTDSNQAAGTARTITKENQQIPNILRAKYGWDLIEVPYYESVDADAYTLTADPSEAEMIIVGFLNGNEEPELFVQDLDRVGTFFDKDVVTMKVRHIWKPEVGDFRGFQLGIP